jgi:DnaK suppressor protein
LTEILNYQTLLRLYEMTKIDLTLQRERLLALRASLLGDMTQMEDDSLKDHKMTTNIPTDMEEISSDNADQELTLSLLGSEEDALDQIEAALQRIEDGSYGECEECGEQIPKSRLEAIPFAAQCVQCASQQENHGPESSRNGGRSNRGFVRFG